MKIKAIVFDLYGTLIDIETDESMEEIYRAIANFLTYEGIDLDPGTVRNLYWQIMRQQKDNRHENYPEISVFSIWNELLRKQAVTSSPRRKHLAQVLIKIFRGVSRKRLALYPNVRMVLEALCAEYPLALVSDAQREFALPEMRTMDLNGFFPRAVLSSDYGFRKPDPRLFKAALDLLKVRPKQAIYIGNDMYRDIYGAGRLGMKTIFFRSNQGVQSHPDARPDCEITDFQMVLDALKSFS